MNEPNDKTTVPSVDDVVHTPGPWRVEDRVTNKERSGFNILVGTPTTDVCEVYNDDEEAIVNARLVASAPDLLRACELVEMWMLGGKPGPHSDSAVLEVVRNAIHCAKTKVV